MKPNKFLVALIFCMASGLAVRAQKEEVLVLTDRGCYMSGETIYYAAFYQGFDGGSKSELSKVLYVELVTPNGNSLAHHKIPIESSGGTGKVIIPEGLSSGTYYLKAYTRWMRDCGPDAFSYTSIQVFDPIKESVLPVDTSGWKVKTPWQMIGQPGGPAEEPFECRMEKSSFSTRELIYVGLIGTTSVPSRVSISVTKAGLHGNQGYFHPGCLDKGEGKSTYLLETKGVTLTGQAVNAADKSPAAYATIYVTVLGNDREFFCNYSDSAGRFFFSFPAYLDNRDLFVSTFHPEYEALELLIDRDFNTDQLTLPSFPVLLNDTMERVITEMSVNFQISQQYYPVQIRYPKPEAGDNRLFYGHPSSTILFDDFINLPRMEEYFTEVVPQVSVKKTRGVKRLVVMGEHPDLQIYQPLVMIDGVAIFDVEAVLAVSPRLIDRVEIVNAPYIRGNVTFGGIISLISRKNDLGFIDLPSSGLLVNYQMLDLPLEDTILSAITDSRLPDVRNTLYWNPFLDLQPGTATEFSFFTSDAKGEYELLIRGMDESGTYFSKSVPFRVK